MNRLQSGRGRPPTVEKAMIPLDPSAPDDPGQQAVVRLIGTGSELTVELPSGWRLCSLSSSVTQDTGRTRAMFTKDVLVIE